MCGGEEKERERERERSYDGDDDDDDDDDGDDDDGDDDDVDELCIAFSSHRIVQRARQRQARTTFPLILPAHEGCSEAHVGTVERPKDKDSPSLRRTGHESKRSIGSTFVWVCNDGSTTSSCTGYYTASRTSWRWRPAL